MAGACYCHKNCIVFVTALNQTKASVHSQKLTAGVALPPVAADGVAGSSKPFFITAQLLQNVRRKVFPAVTSGMAEGFQQSSSDQHRNLVLLESKKPSSLRDVKSRGDNFPTQEFSLFGRENHKLKVTRCDVRNNKL